MLRFFRINDPYRIVFIFLILIVVRTVQSQFIEGTYLLELKWLVLGEWLGKGFYMYRDTYDYTGPLAAMVYKLVDILFGRSPFAHHALSSVLIIFQAGVFNSILLRNKAYEESNYLPAFFYVLLMLFIPDFMALSPQLMSMTFILFALGSVLRRIDNQATDELFLNSGLFVGVATMIFLPSFLFFFVFLFSLMIFSSAIVRRLSLYLFGFVLVIGLCTVFFYWRGDLSYYTDAFLKQGLFLDAQNILVTRDILLITSPLALVFIIAVFKTFSSVRLTNFQQRVQQVMWFMFLGGIGTFVLTNTRLSLELVFLVPLIAYFLTYYFMSIKRRLSLLLMPVLVVFGLLGFNIYSYQNLLGSAMVKPIETRSEKVLVLGENLGYYVNKKAGTPCFCEAICETAFDGLAFYESSIHIFKWIEKANPDLIIDELGVVPAIFGRFPLVAKRYREDGQGKYVRISN